MPSAWDSWRGRPHFLQPDSPCTKTFSSTILRPSPHLPFPTNFCVASSSGMLSSLTSVRVYAWSFRMAKDNNTSLSSAFSIQCLRAAKQADTLSNLRFKTPIQFLSHLCLLLLFTFYATSGYVANFRILYFLWLIKEESNKVIVVWNYIFYEGNTLFITGVKLWKGRFHDNFQYCKSYLPLISIIYDREISKEYILKGFNAAFLHIPLGFFLSMNCLYRNMNPSDKKSAYSLRCSWDRKSPRASFLIQ